MISIFEEGVFSKYSYRNLNESTGPILAHSQFTKNITTVFVSHKHDDLEELKGLLGFLEQTYDVKVYIDSKDTTMPKITSGDTALNLKERIKKCDKFILLATNGAIESKWCNWELGYGDAQKYKEHIALFPIKPKNSLDISYKGSEYMDIYPHITYYNGTEFYKDGTPIPKGYYVRTKENNGYIITPLAIWFSRR